MGCSGLAEGNASEPLRGHTSHGRITHKCTVCIHSCFTLLLLFILDNSNFTWPTVTFNHEKWIHQSETHNNEVGNPFCMCMEGTSNRPESTLHGGGLYGRTEPQQDPLSSWARFSGPLCFSSAGLSTFFCLRISCQSSIISSGKSVSLQVPSIMSSAFLDDWDFDTEVMYFELSFDHQCQRIPSPPGCGCLEANASPLVWASSQIGRPLPIAVWLATVSGPCNSEPLLGMSSGCRRSPPVPNPLLPFQG